MISGMKRAALAAAALVGLMASAHAADELRVGTPEGTAYVFTPIDVGNGAGIFEKHGLAVEKLNFAGGEDLRRKSVKRDRRHDRKQFFLDDW